MLTNGYRPWQHHRPLPPADLLVSRVVAEDTFSWIGKAEPWGSSFVEPWDELSPLLGPLPLWLPPPIPPRFPSQEEDVGGGASCGVCRVSFLSS